MHPLEFWNAFHLFRESKENLWVVDCFLEKYGFLFLLSLNPKFLLVNYSRIYMMVVYIVIHVCIFGDLNCLSKANLKSTLKGDESSFLLSMPENMKTRGFSNFSEAFLFFWVKDSRKTMEWGSQPKLQLPRELLASLQPALSKGFFTSQARRVRWNTDAWWRIGRSVFHCAGAAGNEEVKSDGVISSASLVSSKATNFHHFTPSVPLLQTALLSQTQWGCAVKFWPHAGRNAVTV